MAGKKKAENASVKMFKITVKTNPNFVGTGAGGVQFAHGSAVIADGRMVNWFREHDGYEVTAVDAEDGGADTNTGDGQSDSTDA